MDEVFKTDEYPKNIYKDKNYWIISIIREEFRIYQSCRTDQYTLEEIKEISNKIYKEHGISIND